MPLSSRVRRLAIALVVVGSVALSGCDPDTVNLAFRPKPGATYDFEVTARARTTTTLPGEAPDVARTTTVVRARQRILSTGPDGVRVEVRLEVADVGVQTYVVQLDRAAQLTKVESVEGIPAAALGELGLTEIFPAAAAAPPERPLRPGDRWEIDDRVQLGGLPGPTRLRGAGRLAELGVIDDNDTATVRSRYELPLTQTTSTSSGQGTLEGTQLTDVVITYDLRDGAVRRARATTTGTFVLRLSPPPGEPGRPIEGTLEVELQSETRRVG